MDQFLTDISCEKNKESHHLELYTIPTKFIFRFQQTGVCHHVRRSESRLTSWRWNYQMMRKRMRILTLTR